MPAYWGLTRRRVNFFLTSSTAGWLIIVYRKPIDSNFRESCLNFWDEAWWFLSLRVFGLLSLSLLLFPYRFGRYVLRPYRPKRWGNNNIDEDNSSVRVYFQRLCNPFSAFFDDSTRRVFGWYVETLMRRILWGFSDPASRFSVPNVAI